MLFGWPRAQNRLKRLLTWELHMATRLLLPFGSIATFYHDLSCITLTASKRRWRRWRQRWQLSVIVLLIHSVLSCDSGVGLFVVGSVAAERPLLHQRNFKQRCMLSGSFPRECGMTTSKPHRICLRTYTTLFIPSYRSVWRHANEVECKFQIVKIHIPIWRPFPPPKIGGGNIFTR